MSSQAIASPPYASYSTFTNFISGLRETVIPDHVTKSALPGSNSGKATMSASLKRLNLIDASEVPQPILLQLVESEENYSKNLKIVLEECYPFINDGSINLKTTTTDKLAEKFKEMGATGSTIQKAIAFFLAACKDAAIEISPHVKAPSSSTGSKSTKKRAPAKPESPENPAGITPIDEAGYTPFEIPIPGAKPVKLMLPEGLNEGQWTMFKAVLDAYLEQFQLLNKATSNSQGGEKNQVEKDDESDLI